MNVLCIGDVVGNSGVEYLCRVLPSFKRENNIDICIVNGENADKSGVGITRHSADDILSHGADVITTGNHCFRRCEPDFFSQSPFVICPANHPAVPISCGVAHLDFGKFSVDVFNISGVAFMDTLDNPFDTLDKLLAESTAKFKIIDFHAESTAEKKAFAYYADGKVSAVFGTHTHIPTQDACILPLKTGYITDIGMTGPINSVIGVVPALAIQKQRLHIPVKFEVADGECKMQGVIFTLNDLNAYCEKINNISI